MAHIYITEEAKQSLDDLCQAEKRTISKQVEFLIDKRTQEIEAIQRNNEPEFSAEAGEKS
jgi:primosomal protein N''